MRNRFLSQIADLIGDVGRAQAASRAYERLSVLSDERLAARGLKRGDIAAAAFDEAFGK